MRPLPFLAVALVLCVPLGVTLCVPPAGAQVTLNLDAIDQPQGKPQQPGARPARPAQARPAAPKPGTAQQQPQKPAGGGNAATATPAGKPGAAGAAPAAGAAATGGTAAAAGGTAAAAAAAAAITLPAAPEPMPTIAPPPAPQAAPAPPPRPATVANAGSAVAPTQAGARVTFAAGKSDLSPEAGEALRKFALAAPKDDMVTFNVAAYAAGDKDDPSTSRRLALARALQIRTALMAEGIASTRIYVRAYGTTGDAAAGPADRVDIATLGPATAAAVAPATAPPGTTAAPAPANMIIAPAPAKP